MKKNPINLPNALSFIRVLLVPAFVASLLFMRKIEIWGLIVPALLYIVTAVTDFLDGMIARKYKLVTDFGKFIDPLADKFMVIASQIALLVHMLLRGEYTLSMIFVWIVLIILFRELAVTSIRLVVADKAGLVVAASMLGKIKTVSQMVGTVVIIVEPLLPFFGENRILSYVAMAVMAITTLYSGIDYLIKYLPHIDANK